MAVSSLSPLADVPIEPALRVLPKADLHIHQEAQMRLDRVLARRDKRSPHDWQGWVRRLMDETRPGMPRLEAMTAAMPLDRASDADPEAFIARMVDLLEEEAADGAILVEVIVGPDAALRPAFMRLFREAERRARERYPALHAEALGYLHLVADPDRLPDRERMLGAYLEMASEGLAGVNFSTDPYDREADPALWTTAYRWAERASGAGLGITVHAAEFSTANLAAALGMPGIARVGHATYAPREPLLLDLLAERGVVVECSLSCNVILGSAPAYAAHPFRQFIERGIPLTLGTDNPVRFATTIGREYALAAALGCSPAELLGFTRTAIRASFTSAERRTALLAGVDSWEAEQVADGET